jgi:hypothetical protein
MFPNRAGASEYESTLERDLSYLLEHNRTVTEFEVQPLLIAALVAPAAFRSA